MKVETSTALVLSGGAALGAAHVGVLKNLESRGFFFDFYAGVSAGALICALSAVGKNASEIQAILDEINFFSLAFDFKKSRFAFLRGDKVKTLIDREMGEKRIEELPVKLLIGATDFATGERIILRKGKISDALRASISVPVLFEPYYHPEEKRWLADGGLTQNFPLDLAIAEYRGKSIVAVDVTASVLKPLDFAAESPLGKTKSLAAIAQRAIHILLCNQQRDIPPDPRVHKIVPDLSAYTVMDIFKLKDIVEAGEKAAQSLEW